MSILGDIINKISALPQKKHMLSVDDLIKIEAKIGSQVFGPTPRDRTREFFCVDAHTWIWRETYTDEMTGKVQLLTTRYEINDNGIIKVQDGLLPKQASLDESRNLLNAARSYYSLISARIYNQRTT